jgi:hypothetical protein
MSVDFVSSPRLTVCQIHLFNFFPWCFKVQKYASMSWLGTSYRILIEHGCSFTHKTSVWRVRLQEPAMVAAKCYSRSPLECKQPLQSWDSPADLKCRPSDSVISQIPYIYIRCSRVLCFTLHRCVITSGSFRDHVSLLNWPSSSTSGNPIGNIPVWTTYCLCSKALVHLV